MYRFANNMEDMSIGKIEAGIRGIKAGTKTPEEARVGYFLGKLKDLNPAMYEELIAKYIVVKEAYDKKNQ